MMAQPTVVIVVDDNASLLKSVARLLAQHGIESRAFASAEALLASDSMHTATCLLLDIHLGGISGIELQRRLAISLQRRLEESRRLVALPSDPLTKPRPARLDASPRPRRPDGARQAAGRSQA